MAGHVSADRVYIVGIGDEGMESLSPRARAIVLQAETLAGGERLLAMVPPAAAERLPLGSGIAGTVEALAQRLGERRVVVLASGDPGFFGIAGLLVERLGKDRVEIIPAVSSLQLAFARIKESWDDASFLSVHGRSLVDLAKSVAGRPKVAILTDDTNSPTAVARALLAAGIEEYHAYVCENLATPRERVLALTLPALAATQTDGRSILVLLRQDGLPARGAEVEVATEIGPWQYGIPDEEFAQRRPQRGLLTKLEVRLVSLAKLGLNRSSIAWDIGAGSGAVAIEAAMVARAGTVYAVERDDEGIALIHRNLAKFGTKNVVVVHRCAPEALAGLPAPDAVFVGGSGGQLAGILDVVAGRLRPNGRVVVNAATLETAGAALAGLKERDFTVESTLLQVARSKDLGGLTHFAALNPVFVIAGRRVSAQ